MTCATRTSSRPTPSSRWRTDTIPESSTRDRLLDEAERLFASSGIDRVTSREIVGAADQRNVSAVSYHFGSREGLLLEILARRGGPVDDARGRQRDAVGSRPALRSLVACLVEPYTALLDDPGGRSYLRIVAQLRGRFAAWRVESDESTTKHLSAILDEIEACAPGKSALRRERIVGLIMVLTGMTAERARRIDTGAANETSDLEFVDDLIAMCAAIVTG